MSKKNLLSGRDKELQELAEQYEAAKAENKPIYLDADDLADLADWYAMHGKSEQATEVVEYGLRLHPNSTPLLVEQAYLFMDAQKRDKAKQIIDQIPESYSSEVKVLKANILLGEGKTDEAEQLLDADIRAVLGFSPVNYYATKDRYLLCTFWYTDDLSEIYMRFELRVDDLPHGHTKMYQIDKVLMRDILRKFGQNINIGE